MDKKNLLKEMSYKLRKIRLSLRYSPGEMADSLGVFKSSYSRYEKGETPIKALTLFKLGEDRDISLDWMVRGKGPMYYKQKEIEEKEKEVKVEPQPTLDSLQDDIRELIEYIEKVPVLRYEILLFLQKFKKENKEMVDAAMKK